MSIMFRPPGPMPGMLFEPAEGDRAGVQGRETLPSCLMVAEEDGLDCD